MARGRHRQDDDNVCCRLRNETSRIGTQAAYYRAESQCARNRRYVPQGIPYGQSSLSGQGRFYPCQQARGLFKNQEQQLGLHHTHARPVRQDTAVRRDHDRYIHGRACRCGT